MANLAKQTLALIDETIRRDQGASYRGHLGKAVAQIKDAYNAEPEARFRSHLGASIIGETCERKLWLGFRWAQHRDFNGRLLRLFNRGHQEEARFIALLQTIGCTVHSVAKDGGQFRISDFGGHFGSAVDCVIVGCPDAPEPILGEFKTHNDKSFQSLKNDGVREAKFGHYAQIQVCMKKLSLPKCLYLAVNKNDDELYGEIINADAIGDQALDRANRIIFSNTSPERLKNASPSWWECKYCDYSSVCFGKVAPEENCRTCRFSSPQQDGTWHCTKHDTVLSKEAQLSGCSSYSANPSFV